MINVTGWILNLLSLHNIHGKNYFNYYIITFYLTRLTVFSTKPSVADQMHDRNK